ncbi:MAG: ribose-phosphate diphosphokinase [Candidatus Aminicenantes bacterium]|nr:ribose-phosphate diphosphokinase [Candidatus Aminicenantes bacterium]
MSPRKKATAAPRPFLTPEQYADEQKRRMESTRGRLLIASCRSGAGLAAEAIESYNRLLQEAGSRERVLVLSGIDANFSDSETWVRLALHVSGYDVFLFQSALDPTSPRSIDQNMMALFIAARAFREHGANHVTAVLPYLAYARQDKPTKFEREPTTARLMADLAITSGIDRLVVWDPHGAHIRGFYGSLPVQMLESLTLFLGEFRRFAGRSDVIAVAPDEGAAKFIGHFGRALGLPTAIASKYRPKPEVAVIKDIIGDFRGKRTAIILDDMISGGGTTYELSKKLVEKKGIREIHIGISHNLGLASAKERLEELHRDFHLKRLIVTDSIPQTDEYRRLPFITIRSLADTLARTVNRIHYGRSVSEVFYRPSAN